MFGYRIISDEELAILKYEKYGAGRYVEQLKKENEMLRNKVDVLEKTIHKYMEEEGEEALCDPEIMGWEESSPCDNCRNHHDIIFVQEGDITNEICNECEMPEMTNWEPCE